MTLSNTHAVAVPQMLKEVSLVSGTVFEESRLPIGQALLLIYYSVNRFSYKDAIREASMGDSQPSRKAIV